MRHKKELISCNNCGRQFETANQHRDWCCLICKEALEKRQKNAVEPKKAKKRGAKESIFTEEDTRPYEEKQREASHRNYYWIMPYMKRLKLFFATDIEQELKKDDIYFSKKDILKAIQYWVDCSCIQILPTNYVISSGGKTVKKYVYVKDPE